MCICYRCNGLGYLWEELCSVCGGTGDIDCSNCIGCEEYYEDEDENENENENENLNKN